MDAAGVRTWIDPGYLGDLRREDAKTDKEASLALYRQWLAVRTADIELVIDWLIGAEPAYEAVAAVHALVDGSRIGLIGHSLGGSAALGVGRVRAREGGVAGRDGAAGADGAGGERAVGAIAAVIALEAPLLADIVGVAGGEFVIDAAPYPVPVLNVYTDDTWGRLAELPQYAGNVALLGRQDAQVSNVHIAGARHLGLTDLALTSPLLTRLLGSGSQAAGAREVLGEVNRLALGFLSTHLGGVDAD